MSSVRMCDRCGAVFSELVEGWQTYQALTFKRDDEGRRVSVPVSQDACPTCAIPLEAPEPMTPHTNDGFFERKQLEARASSAEDALSAAEAEVERLRAAATTTPETPAPGAPASPTA